MAERRRKCPRTPTRAPRTLLTLTDKSDCSSVQCAEPTVQRGTGPWTCQVSDPEDGRTDHGVAGAQVGHFPPPPAHTHTEPSPGLSHTRPRRPLLSAQPGGQGALPCLQVVGQRVQRAGAQPCQHKGRLPQGSPQPSPGPLEGSPHPEQQADMSLQDVSGSSQSV